MNFFYKGLITKILSCILQNIFYLKIAYQLKTEFMAQVKTLENSFNDFPTAALLIIVLLSAR